MDDMDDTTAQAARAERNAIETAFRARLNRLTDDEELARARMGAENRAVGAIFDALTADDPDLWDDLPGRVGVALSDDQIVALVGCLMRAIPADRLIWLCRDLFGVNPFPFSDQKQTEAQMIGDARTWAKDAGPHQRKAYAAEIIKAMPKSDRRRLYQWLRGQV